MFSKSVKTPPILEVHHKYKWDVITGEVEFSDSWFTSLGYEPDELPHNVETWQNLVCPECMPYVWKELEPCLKGATNVFKCVNRLRRKDGTYRWNLDHGKVTERNNRGEALMMEGYDIPLLAA